MVALLLLLLLLSETSFCALEPSLEVLFFMEAVPATIRLIFRFVTCKEYH